MIVQQTQVFRRVVDGLPHKRRRFRQLYRVRSRFVRVWSWLRSWQVGWRVVAWAGLLGLALWLGLGAK